MAQLTRAERLLQDLGVTEPKDIDLEAIAFHLGARVRFRRLDGCEARIIGCNDKAIITIHEDSKPSRKRFSLAHEIGHYAEVRIMPRRRAAFGQMHSISATYRHNQSGGTWLLSGSEALPAACSATSISAIKVSI